MMHFGRLVAADPALCEGTPTVRLIAPSRLSEDDWTCWQRLADEADGSAIFSEPWFMRAALAATANAAALRVAIVEADGRWLGVLPLARSLKLGRLPLPHLIGWRDPNQFVGAPLVAKGQEDRFWQALLTALDRLSSTRFALSLSLMPADAVTTRALIEQCADGARVLTILKQGERAAMATRDGSQAYCEAHCDRRRATRLRSQWRSLSSMHEVTIRTLEPEDRIDDWIEAFFWLENLGWKGREGSALASGTRSVALFRGAATAAHVQGKLRFVMLVADGMPVAMSSFLVAGTRAFGFKAAYDERFARYAPGLQLLREVGRQVDPIRPLTFDSCTPTGPSIIAEFWKDSVTMLDVAVSLGRGSSLLRGAVSAADGWHGLKIRAAPRLQA